jgi:hypothetical protein
MGMLNSAGLMWSPELVGWGYQASTPTRELLGYYAARLDGHAGRGALPEVQRKRQTLNFWGFPGVYALYKGDTTVYVGQASRLGDRLLSHYRTDHLVGRWDAFSWVSPTEFVERINTMAPRDIEPVPLARRSPTSTSLNAWLTEIEALVILMAKPIDNRQIPKPGDHPRFFTQIRSEHADPTQVEMLEKLYAKLILGR